MVFRTAKRRTEAQVLPVRNQINSDPSCLSPPLSSSLVGLKNVENTHGQGIGWAEQREIWVTEKDESDGEGHGEEENSNGVQEMAKL